MEEVLKELEEINRVLENKDSRIPSIDELINNRQWKR